MVRCETCGRVLTIKDGTRHTSEGETILSFCSDKCKDMWKTAIRSVSVAH
ncbi:MAG: hypothetical protein WED05_07710 [Candidatus Atabeyarchaeum deiterrae]